MTFIKKTSVNKKPGIFGPQGTSYLTNQHKQHGYSSWTTLELIIMIYATKLARLFDLPTAERNLTTGIWLNLRLLN
jgi:hypothetical protein